MSIRSSDQLPRAVLSSINVFVDDPTRVRVRRCDLGAPCADK